MKGTENFKAIIFSHLQKIALKDKLFAQNFNKKSKSIDDCIVYILNQVKASGCNGFDDEEIYNMAIHYYDEDDLKIGKPIKAQVVVNHSSEKFKPSKEENPIEKKVKVVKLQPTNQVSIFDIPGV